MASDPSGERAVPSFDERFAGIVRPVVGQLVHVAQRILGSEDLAWEAVQEALLSLWLQGSPPQNPRALKGRDMRAGDDGPSYPEGDS